MNRLALLQIAVLLATAAAPPAPGDNPACLPSSAICAAPHAGRSSATSAVFNVYLPILLGEAPPAPPFYAFYYLWWSRRHWHEKLGVDYPWDGSWPLPGTLDPETGCGATPGYHGSTLVDLPLDGAYDQPTNASDEQLSTSIFATHVREAAASGLTGFLAAWQGTGQAGETIRDSGYNKRLDGLIRTIRSYNATHGGNFHYIIDYETFHEIRTATQIANDIDYLLANYGSDTAWGRIDDRLVFYWHDTRSFPAPTLQAIYERFADRLFIIGEERRITWTAERARYLDGTGHYWSTQDPYRNPQSFQQTHEFAALVHASGRRWFAPLAPGYNDELNEHAQGRPVGAGDCVPRRDTATLRVLYEGNRASSPDGWFVISWNEWVEHTYIEPSKRYGSRYLDELARIIDGE